MATTGQTINDRLNAMRYALAGQGLARTVCKATTEEIIGPKKKHLEYLVSCTNEPNVSIPQLSNLLIERTRHSSWAVVFKSLISIHHLMSFGEESFIRYLATSNFSFELNDFMDRTTPQGYGMSPFVRRYAKYINQKSVSYRTLAIDLCKIRLGNDNALKTMNVENLSKTLPIVQGQFDALLEFEAETKDLNNGIILSAFRLLYKDLVKLYVAYQEAIVNLLERFCKLSLRKAREALKLYKNYLSRMDKVEGFLKTVDAIGLDKSEMPDLTKSPASILEVLERHLAQLEAKKRGATPASPDPEDDGSNKENETGEAESHATKAAAEAATTSSDAKTAQGTAGTSKPATGGEDKATPAPTASAAPKKPPPTRPSPVASPKISPSTNKANTTQPSAASSSEKKAPPGRPAPPPSRPPAPSGATPSSSSSQSQTTSLPATASGPPTSSTKAPSPSPSQATKSSHAPPPHPPPPKASSEQQKAAAHEAESSQAHHEADSTSSTTTTETTAASVEPSSREQNHSDADAGSSAGGATRDEPPTTHTCSSGVAIVDQQVVQDGDQQPEARVNHVANNVNHGANNHVAAEDELPPPPPPIEEAVEQPQPAEVDAPPPPPPPLDEHLDGDEAVAVAADGQPEGQAANQPDEREPRINGQNGDNNNNAEGGNVVVD